MLVGILRAKRTPFIAALFMLIFFTNPFLANRVMKTWEYPAQNLGNAKFEAGVILTGMTIPTIHVPGQLQFGSSAERIIEPLRLFHKEQLNLLIISGGSGNLLRPELLESPALAMLAEDLLVPKERIFVESASRNTFQNARNTKEVLAEQGLEQESILIITSAYHMRRAKACFEKQGIDVIPYPVDFVARSESHIASLIPRQYALELWKVALHEWVGYISYYLVGYI